MRHLLLFQDALAIDKRRLGTRFWLQHRVCLSELWVLYSEKPACGCEEEETALGLECCNTLILIWPSCFCVVTFISQERKEFWLDAILRQRSRAQEMQVTPLPSTGLLVKVLGLSGSPVMLTAPTVKALVQCQAKSIPHHCPQTPRHEEDLRRALDEEQAQELMEPKAPEPEEGRAHAAVQTDLCSDEPGDHGTKVDMVCQADVHLEQQPSLLCSLAEEGGAVARQAEGGESQ
ncbi:uncharacterized protein LOC113490446 isoform X2 [Athene cunicularia]|uniref:uncharacterized protein LOC113490446 isoform X2 n=1 Tax=Athene cunicularia TaxID=194338 RepID=UPI000EF65761|nr:uncharacterized protein LOC113490446 isoform X2 [Athene cunicularia]